MSSGNRSSGRSRVLTYADLPDDELPELGSFAYDVAERVRRGQMTDDEAIRAIWNRFPTLSGELAELAFGRGMWESR